MSDSPRQRRLRSDHRSLIQLKSESSIFDFIPVGDPPDQYILRFRGRSVYRPENSSEAVIRTEHEVLLRLGSGYPRSLPSLTWRTPIFHPNIASSGVVCLGAYGQHWAPSVTLEELVTMLWEMLRYANFDVDSPYNREAANWAKSVERHRFPLDPRPLRDITAGLASTRAVPSPHVLRSPAAFAGSNGHSSRGSAAVAEVIFLDDNLGENLGDVVEAEVVEVSGQSVDDGILFIS
jgi:ubiquitin-protein ligase